MRRKIVCFWAAVLPAAFLLPGKFVYSTVLQICREAADNTYRHALIFRQNAHRSIKKVRHPFKL